MFVPEIGNFALILALVVGVVLGTLPLIGVIRNNLTWMQIANLATRLQFILLSIAIWSLGYSFLNDDFSVLYISLNSNSELPNLYKLSAIWGGHEGSLLLWVYLLSLWMVAFSIFSKNLPNDLKVRILSILGLVTIGFLLFLLLTSNPFDRSFPAAFEGRDLNPLLQDFGLAIHPPMLYMGYVGFSIPFAFAIAALLKGNLDATWARGSRPWTLMAWVFLTIGISLGSFWSYYELGWGGWWFWDPVENASFMPWLMGTALLHSLAVAEKRGSFKSWVALLAIFTFSLSLLGTFLVRSGILVSVHAFATDPKRGLFILAFLVIVVLASLILYMIRVNHIRETGNFSSVSRESFLLVNNVILVSAMLVVLIGTLYPLILSALDIGKISVGLPYFNKSFTPLMLMISFLIGFGIIARWKNDKVKRILQYYKWIFPISCAIGILIPWLIFDVVSWGINLAIAIASWTIITSLKEPFAQTGKHGLWVKIKNLPAHRYGMMVSHIGIGVFIIGVTFVTHMSIEKDVKMSVGSKLSVADYQFQINNIKEATGANYKTTIAEIIVSSNNKELYRLYPEKRIYNSNSMPMTEVSINSNIWRDLYIAMGEFIGDAWAVRIYYKPFMRWIWLGSILMALGGILSAVSKRYRISVR